MARAVDLVSAEGLGNVSLARLGADLRISKSGVSGHFASREHLQLAVIAVAARLYADRVATPALTRPDGLPQLWALCEGWIDFMRSEDAGRDPVIRSGPVRVPDPPGPVDAEQPGGAASRPTCGRSDIVGQQEVEPP